MHLSRPDLPSPEPGLPALPDRVFLARSHRDVVGALCRGLAEPDAVVAVTGAAGIGKTTLVNAVVAALTGDAGPVWHAGDTGSGAPAALRPLLDRVPAGDLPACSMSFVGSFAGVGNPAARSGASDILVLDDAHELSPGFLRGLSAVLLGSGLDSLLPRLVLVGRPEFWSRLDDPHLAFLQDRIDVRISMQPVPHHEAEGFVEHLFRLAGGSASSLLPAEVLHGLLVRSHGNPRQIIAELEKLLALGEADRHRPVADRQAENGPALREPASRRRRWPARRWITLVSGVGGAAAALVAAATLLPREAPKPEPSTADVALAPAPAERQPAVSATTTSNEGNPPAERLDEPAPGPPEVTERASAEPTPHGTETPPREEAARDLARTSEPALPLTEPAAAPEDRPAEPGTGAEAVVPQPAPPPAVASPPVRPARQELPRDLVAALVRRGNAMLELRDVSAARRLFERAALAGSAEAAAALARTYDPGLQAGAAWEVGTDREVAVTWYKLAASLGDEDARQRLDQLGKEAGR